MKIKFEKINPKAIIPRRALPRDAGIDFFTYYDITIPSRATAIISTGLRYQLDEENAFLLIKDKSGVAAKKGVHVLAGVVDNEYRGEIKILLYNHSQQDVQFRSGDKIAQGIVLPVYYADICEGKISTKTTRGEGGFGHTGENIQDTRSIEAEI